MAAARVQRIRAMASDNAMRLPLEKAAIDSRVVVICAVSILLALLTGFIAQALVGLIGLITNVAFYGRLSTAFISPAGNRLGPLVILVPILGGIVVGIVARYGSKAIRGHGIPEAMKQVLLNESRISPRHRPEAGQRGRLLGVVTPKNFMDRDPNTRVGDLVSRPRPSSSSTIPSATPPTTWCARTLAACPWSNAPTPRE